MSFNIVKKNILFFEMFVLTPPIDFKTSGKWSTGHNNL